MRPPEAPVPSPPKLEIVTPKPGVELVLLRVARSRNSNLPPAKAGPVAA